MGLLTSARNVPIMRAAVWLTPPRSATARPNRRVFLQLRLDRYFASPPKACYINKLPNELIAEILVYTAHDTTHVEKMHCDPIELPDKHWSTREDTTSLDEPDDSQCIAGLRFVRGCATFCHEVPWNWLEVNRVCKRWRDVAHSSHEFWSRIPLQSLRATVRSLQCSGTFPLRLIAHFNSPWQARNCLKHSLEQLHRISEISLTGKTIYTCSWEDVGEWLCSPAPALQRLCLN